MSISDNGATWTPPTTIFDFEMVGNISKMTANLLFVTANGTWLLPVWGEAHTAFDLLPDFSAALISLDQGQTWKAYGNITNNSTWSDISHELYCHDDGLLA